MNHKLQPIISAFEPISLEETDRVSLMNRVDSKYVFSIQKLSDILSDAVQNYKILEINSVRQHLYDSLYFDTKEFQMYYKHLYKRLNRHKVRFRKYVNTNGLTFLEIKFKDNKEKTYKKRKQWKDITPYFSGEIAQFVEQKTPFSKDELLPTLQIQYFRCTLVNNDMTERVTIDTQLMFNNFSRLTKFENIVIAEVKRANFSEHTPFLGLLKKMKIREGGLSKYCTGMSLTYPNLKKNNFLLQLRYFEKLNKINGL